MPASPEGMAGHGACVCVHKIQSIKNLNKPLICRHNFAVLRIFAQTRQPAILNHIAQRPDLSAQFQTL
jgi:hypothetical protein